LNDGGAMNYWILQSNPNHFHWVEGQPQHFYSVGDEDWWGVSYIPNQMRQGDIAFVWQSIDYRNPTGSSPRGIYARARVVSVPEHQPDIQRRIDNLKRHLRPHWQDTQQGQHQESKPTVLIRYDDSYVANPLTAEELIEAGLGGIHIIRCPRPEVTRLSEEDTIRIEVLLSQR